MGLNPKTTFCKNHPVPSLPGTSRSNMTVWPRKFSKNPTHFRTHQFQVLNRPFDRSRWVLLENNFNIHLSSTVVSEFPVVFFFGISAQIRDPEWIGHAVKCRVKLLTSSQVYPLTRNHNIIADLERGDHIMKLCQWTKRRKSIPSWWNLMKTIEVVTPIINTLSYRATTCRKVFY